CFSSTRDSVLFYLLRAAGKKLSQRTSIPNLCEIEITNCYLAAARAVPSNLSHTVFTSCVDAANDIPFFRRKFHSTVAFPTIMVVLETACVKAKSLHVVTPREAFTYNRNSSNAQGDRRSRRRTGGKFAAEPV